MLEYRILDTLEVRGSLLQWIDDFGVSVPDDHKLPWAVCHEDVGVEGQGQAVLDLFKLRWKYKGIQQSTSLIVLI